MVTASTNGYLNIWNTKTHRDSHSTMLEALPSYLTFSEDDHFLAVGLRNGKVLIFSDSESAEFELVSQVKGTETPDTPAVLRVVFSKDNKMMAVSYMIVGNTTGTARDIYAKKGGYIVLYELKKPDIAFKGPGFDIKYTKKSVIWNPRCSTQEKTNSMGCYFLTFDREHRHIIASFQNVDSYLNRDLDDKDKYLMIYNLKEESEETNKDLLKKLELDKFEFPDQINSFQRALISNFNQNEK